MGIKNFTADEICRIIKAVGESRVTLLKIGSLEIHSTSSAEIGIESHGRDFTPAAPPAIVAPNLETPQDTPPQGLKPEREIELDQALIEDPLAYEQAVMRGELDGKDS